MHYSDNIRKAVQIAFQAHENQIDKSGYPYIMHPLHVAETMPDEATTIVALLHDVVEDTSIILEDLSREGFSTEIIEAIDCLTHDKSIPYEDYIKKISTNRIASIVKQSDLKHNSDLTRLDLTKYKDQQRVEKYKKAEELLDHTQHTTNL